jgi:hypothetical protein
MKKILMALTLALLCFTATHAQSNVGQGQTATSQGALKPEMNAVSVSAGSPRRERLRQGDCARHD